MLHPSSEIHKLNVRTTSPVGQSPLIKMSERVIGTVKWFNDAKGLGLITQDENGQDIFCTTKQSNLRVSVFVGKPEGLISEGPVNKGSTGGSCACIIVIVTMVQW